MDVFRREGDVAQPIVAAKRMKLAGGWVKQGKPRPLRTFRRADEMDFGRYPGLGRVNGQGIEGFCHHLRREAGHGEQNAAGEISVLHGSGFLARP